MYLKELEFKVKYQCGHAKILNLDVTFKEETFMYKLFDKRNSFPFFIMGISHFKKSIFLKIFFIEQLKVSF